VVGLGLLLLVGVFVISRTEDFGDEQAANDRQLVDCLTNQLTHEEKQQIAQDTAVHDSEAIRSIYVGLLPRCVVRDDQWERKGILITTARQALKSDPEFQRMVSAASSAKSAN
jgi:hypothetical protein